MFHKKLLNILNKRYSEVLAGIELGGVCHYYALLALSAALVDQFALFEQKRVYIETHYQEITANDTPDQLPFGTLQFLDSIMRLVLSSGITQTSAVPVHQLNLEAVLQLISNPLVNAEGGLIFSTASKEDERKQINDNRWSWQGIYPIAEANGGGWELLAHKKETLLSYLEILDEIIKKYNISVSFLFTGKYHSIVIHFNAASQSYFGIDINQPHQILNSLLECQAFIKEGFHVDIPIFSTSLLTLGKNRQVAEQIVADLQRNSLFQSIHDLNIHKVQLVNSDQVTLAYIAAQNNQPIFLKKLLEAGANPNHQNQNGGTLLYYAAQNGLVEVMEVLIGAGADLDLRHKNGATPAYIAAQQNYSQVIARLASAHADLELADPVTSARAIHVAAESNHIEVMKELIKAHVDLNAVDNDGLTALSIAVQEGYQEMVTLLMEAGANLNKADKNGIRFWKRQIQVQQHLVNSKVITSTLKQHL